MVSNEAAWFSGLWMATSAAAVNYSRSALPPAPAMVLMLLGLMALGLRRSDSLPSLWRALLCGLLFAGAVLFHPGYVLYLSIPCTFVLFWPESRDASASIRWERRLVLVVVIMMSTPLLMLAYDAPNVAFHFAQGRLSFSDFVYVKGFKQLLGSPTVYGGHEGLLFWPRYLLAAEGRVGAVALLLFVAAAAVPRRDVEAVIATRRLFLWALVPWLLWTAWLSVNSYGRLFAPLLLPLAGLVGLGASRARGMLERLGVHRVIAHVGLACVVAIPGMIASTAIILTPGPEPALARWAVANGYSAYGALSAIAFERSDRIALTPIQLVPAYVPDDLRRAFCSGRSQYLVLSPGALYLSLRHYDFLAHQVRLSAVRTAPSPFRVPLRLFEGQSPSERTQVSNDPFFAELGLYRVESVYPPCMSDEAVRP